MKKDTSLIFGLIFFYVLPNGAVSQNILSFRTQGQRYGVADLDHFWLSKTKGQEGVFLQRACEVPTGKSAGKSIPRSAALGKYVWGQFGASSLVGFPGQPGGVWYSIGKIPDSTYINIRYSKYSESTIPVEVYLNELKVAEFIPIDQGSWDRFTETVWILLDKNHAKPLNPTNVETLIDASYIFKDLGNVSKSEALLKQAMVLDPINPRAQLALGYLYKDEGNFSKALIYFKKASTLKPQDEEYQKTFQYLFEQDGYKLSDQLGVNGVIEFQHIPFNNKRLISDAVSLGYSEPIQLRSLLGQSTVYQTGGQINSRVGNFPKLIFDFTEVKVTNALNAKGGIRR